MSLSATERGRAPSPDGTGTNAEFDLHATGFAAGEDLTLWTKLLDEKYRSVSNLFFDGQGSLMSKQGDKPMLFRASVGGMMAGEPVSWALTSATTNKQAYVRVIVVPIESHSPEEWFRDSADRLAESSR